MLMTYPCRPSQTGYRLDGSPAYQRYVSVSSFRLSKSAGKKSPTFGEKIEENTALETTAMQRWHVFPGDVSVSSQCVPQLPLVLFFDKKPIAAWMRRQESWWWQVMGGQKSFPKRWQTSLYRILWITFGHWHMIFTARHLYFVRISQLARFDCQIESVWAYLNEYTYMYIYI